MPLIAADNMLEVGGNLYNRDSGHPINSDFYFVSIVIFPND